MRVEILGKQLKDAGYVLAQGDTVTVPDDVGAKWCGYGWARDVDGACETAQRKPGVWRDGARRVKPKNIVVNTETK